MPKKSRKDVWFWIPRILTILYILFISVFALDVFDKTSGIWNILLALLINLIPSFILIIILIISWKYELVGGIAFILFGLAYVASVLISGLDWRIASSWSMIISIPAIITGIFWIVAWKRKR
jgi:hypothetical protein